MWSGLPKASGRQWPRSEHPRQCGFKTAGGIRPLALGFMQALSALGNISGSLLSIWIQPGKADFFHGYAGWRLIFFAGIEKVRYRRPVHAGDVNEIEATVLRLRSRMGRLQGVARVNGQPVIEGTMTFALGPPQDDV